MITKHAKYPWEVQQGEVIKNKEFKEAVKIMDKKKLGIVVLLKNKFMKNYLSKIVSILLIF